MDRTSRIGIMVCLAILIYIAFFGMPRTLPKAPVAKPAMAANPAVASTPATIAEAPSTQTTNAAPAHPLSPVPQKLAFLENANIKVTLTSAGASIKEVELKNAKENRTANVILNEQSHTNILQLNGWPDADQIGFQEEKATEAVGPNSATISFVATLPSGVKWQRAFALGKEYALTVADTLTNSRAADVTLPAYSLSVGRAEPLRVSGHYQPISNMYLGSGWLTTEHFHLTTINDFNPGFIPIVGVKTHDEKDLFDSKTVDPARLRWLGAENQFFTVLLTPTPDHLIEHAQFQCYNERDPGSRIAPFPPGAAPDIEAAAFFPALKIPAGKSVTTTYSLYAGPKDFDRLNALGEQQGELMNYGKFELLIVPMLAVLHFFHSFLHNYGVSIILLTLCIKIVTWPLQSFANRSGKRMQAVAPKLKELQAKYKETPEKLNTETFALYKEYGVNPFGGCVPALIQMPVFFSLYYMLQNAGELRGQSFLWVHDLTQPDTIFSTALPFVIPFFGISHFVLNPLPIMVTGLTMVMMRMTPQIGDPAQAKVAQFMPLIFLVFLYNFAAALSLYYVINNCVSIIQIYRNLKKPLPELKRVVKKKK